MSVAVPEFEVKGEEGEQHLVLPSVSWDQYVTVNDAFPDRRGLRMIYVDGSLTVLTLSRRHDWFVHYLDSIIKAIALGSGIEMEIGGSATYRLEGQEVGVEGDRTYYFGPNAEIMSGPINIDLTTQPPPDLAVEVVVSNPADKAVASYARIGVPEVWVHDVKRATLAFLVLSEDGTYRPAARSRAFTRLTPDDVLGHLRLAEELGYFSRWHAQLTDWVRTTLLPRPIEG